MCSGTQVSKWTKMGENLQKIAAHKLVESRPTPTKMTGGGTSGHLYHDEDISSRKEFVSESGAAVCSIGIQVIFVVHKTLSLL